MMAVPNDKQVQEALAELEGPEAKGQGFESSIHPFPARMPFSVAEHLIKRLTNEGQIVLDPMTGSGTTLVAAGRQARVAVGFDRDPLAVMIAKTATQIFDRQHILEVEGNILERARQLFTQMRLPQARKKLPREDQEFLRYWFPPYSQKQLFCLSAAIDEIPESFDRDFAWVVFSSLIIAKSAGASYALDISRSRPHKKTEKQIVYPFKGWRLRYRAAVNRHPFSDIGPNGDIRVFLGDARSLPLGEEKIDLVLTSPPYLTAIDYIRAHKFSLVWMGHNLEKLRTIRGTMMGTERGLWSRDGLPAQLESHLEDISPNGRRQAILRRYLSDFQGILFEIQRVLRRESIAVLLVGPTIVESEHSDAVAVVTQLAENVGLKLIGSVVRPISYARRSLPPPRANGNKSLDRRMHEEVIVALRK